MRKDLEIHIKTGDIALKPYNTGNIVGFSWVEYPEGLSRYIYGEILVPYTTTEESIRNNGVCITIPYTPVYKECAVRVKRVYGDGSYTYVRNQADGSEWYVVKAHLYGAKERSSIYASQLLLISDSSFHVLFQGGFADIYSSTISDFNVVGADRQNSNCLLACVPTNNYRYPLTGVGMVRWINSNNTGGTGLAEIIQREFSEDGMSVRNASYNYDSQDMDIDVDVFNE